MATSKTLIVALTVDGNVLSVASLKLLHVALDGLHATVGTSLVVGDVGVETGTVPVTGDRLGVEGDLDTELFGDTVEEETRHPEVVAHLDTLARTNLVLPLRGHDLSVDTGDVDAGEQAGLVVSLDNVTAVDLAGTDTTVVRALGTGVTTLGPAERPSVVSEEGVFLLKTEPEVLAGVCLHQFGGLMAVVEFVLVTVLSAYLPIGHRVFVTTNRSAVAVPGLAENEDVVALAERVRENSNGPEVDVGVVAGGLAGTGTVEVPFWQLLNGSDRLEQGLREKTKLACRFALPCVVQCCALHGGVEWLIGLR
jgi:hypothetical protein